jgi:hypothetical protein
MGLATGESYVHVPDIYSYSYIPSSDFQIKSINEMLKNSTEGEKTDNAAHSENTKLIIRKTSTSLGFQFCAF